MHEPTEITEGKIDFERLNRAILDEVNPFFLLESIKNNLCSRSRKTREI
jgi:hypothetical protein